MSLHLSDEDVNAILEIDHPSDDAILGLGFDTRCECLQIMAACGAGNISRGLATDYLVKAFAREFPNDVGRPILTRSINEFLHSLRPLQATLNAEMPAAVERGPTVEMMGHAFAGAGIEPDTRLILPTEELKPLDVVELVSAPDTADAEKRSRHLTGRFSVGGVNQFYAPDTERVQATLSLSRGDAISRVPFILFDADGYRWHVIERPAR